MDGRSRHLRWRHELGAQQLAWHRTALDGPPAQVALVTAALLASIFIHAGTNLQNDVGDFRRGADLAGRIGPPRATTEGWLPADHVQMAASPRSWRAAG